jgi:hypothetical protein
MFLNGARMSNTSEDTSYLAHAFSTESKAAVYEAI